MNIVDAATWNDTAIRTIEWSPEASSFAVIFKCGHARPLAFSEIELMRTTAKACAALLRGLQCEVCAGLEVKPGSETGT